MHSKRCNITNPTGNSAYWMATKARNSSTVYPNVLGYRDEITAQNGVLYKVSRVIIPKAQQQQMLAQTHSSHQGAEVCIRRARGVIFCPGLASDIKEMVSQCDVCNNFMCTQQKEPLMTYDIPTHSWKMIAQDLFVYRKQDYLITVDYYSAFWEIDLLPNTTSETIIECTKVHFTRYGIADTVVTDNGPQFRSQEYEKFAATWEFIHSTSSPYHSQSNGKVESAVKIVKKLMAKATADNQYFQLTLLDWRNTPSADSQHSPFQCRSYNLGVHELYCPQLSLCYYQQSLKE